ncbi:MAG: DNA-binding response regulator, partial [Ignavibacteriales bacterium]
AYNQFALQAFEVNAIDYLLKPFSEERLNAAVDKARKKFSEKISSPAPSLPATPDGSFLNRIVIKDGSSIFIVPVDIIKYIEAQDDYVMIHTSDKKYLKQKTMKFYEENLNPAEFIRIHRSFICSVREIKQIELLEKETYQVILADRKKLPVSKSGYEKLREILR